MREICGDTSLTSSKSVLLQLSLENKLKQQLNTDGSILFKMTWKDVATPAHRRYCLLRALVPRTSDTACSGGGLKKNCWRTPTVSDFQGGIRWALKEGALDNYKNTIKNGYLASHHFGLTENGLKAQEGKHFCLNTELSRWLMGFPRSWSSVVDTVMP